MLTISTVHNIHGQSNFLSMHTEIVNATLIIGMVLVC